jgi:hypothetical protein
MSISNIVNPGLVNVADEAYPAPPPGRQRLPRNTGALTPISNDGYPIVPQGVGRLPLLANVDVSLQSFKFPQGFGTPIPPSLVPFLPLIDVVVQDDVPSDPDDITEFVVTQAGSFPTSAAGVETDFETTITAIIDADTGGAPTGTTTRYRITLADSLVPFGITFIGRQAEVVAAADPANIGLTRFIDYWSVNVIFMAATVNPNPPPVTTNLVVGDTLSFDVDRDGFENVSNQLGITANVFLNSEPPLGLQQQVNFSRGRFLGNFLATSGVAVPFVGSGTAEPRFPGTTEVETQTFGRGLPANVFV